MTKDKVRDWDEKASKDNYKQCVIVFLITTYKILIDKGLVNKEVLTEKYINTYFNEKKGFTSRNLIEFVKDELKYASLCIFDCLGLYPIISYSVNDAVVNGDLRPDEFIDEHNQINPKWYKKGVAVLTENHIEGLFNDDEIQSITKLGCIKAFTNHITNDDVFEFFDDIERKLQDDDYVEFGKNNDANVLFYDDIDIIEDTDIDDDDYKALSNVNNKLSTTYRMIKIS